MSVASGPRFNLGPACYTHNDMRPALRKKIKELFPQIEEGRNIAADTTFGVGGDVAFYLRVRTAGELTQVLIKLKAEPAIPYLVMAGGSNLVFGDDRLDKLVIHYLNWERAKPLIKGRIIQAEAGISLAKLVQTGNQAGLAGLETLAGIPGTVGGAVAGNAGAYGRAIGEAVKEIEYFDGEAVATMSGAEAAFAYRHSIFKEKRWVILRVKFALKRSDSDRLKKISREIIRVRNKKYQPTLKCPGSFFKNVLLADIPDPAKIDQNKIIGGKVPAGYLLEQVGACGLKRGGVAVASFHGNLLINTGDGTYREVKALAAILKRRVKRQFGITLEEEIRYLN